MWRVVPLLRPFRVHLAFVVVSSLVSSAGMIAVPLIVAHVIDGPIQEGDTGGVVRWAAVAGGIALSELFLAFGRRYCLTLIATGLETRLRDDLYAHLQRLDVAFHDRWQSGQLLSRAMTDLSVMRRFVGFGAVFFVIIAIQVLGIFTVLVLTHVGLALVTFGAAVPVLVLCRRFGSRYQRIVRVIQDQTGDLTTTIEEGAKGIRVLKAFGRSPEAYEAYRAEARTIHDTQMERIRLHTRFVWVLGIIPNLTLTAVVLVGVLAVGSGSLSVGDLVAFVSYVLMLTFPIEILAWIMAMAGEAETAAVRIYEVFDTEPAIQDRPRAMDLAEARGDLRFEGVSFTFDGGERPRARGHRPLGRRWRAPRRRRRHRRWQDRAGHAPHPPARPHRGPDHARRPRPP
jgi:ATP-binding cassette subfamily B protein